MSATSSMPSGGDSIAPRHLLVFPGSALTTLREALLADAPLESAAFVLARPVRTPAGAWRLVAYEVVQVRADEYDQRTPTAIDLPPAVVARVMQRARADGSAVVATHTHPFRGSVQPSMRDRAGEIELMAAFRRRVPGVPHARLIIGPDSIHAALLDTARDEWPLFVQEIGAELLIFEKEPRAGRTHASSDHTPPERQTYDRQIRAFGEDGQAHLANLRAAVIGLGGTGSVATQQLAHLGVGSMLLIDPDQIEPTNLNRIVGARASDVHRAKVDVARDLVLAVNPAAVVEAIQGDVRDASIIRRLLDVDIFLSCTDSQGSRAALTQLAYQYLVPGIDVGVAIHVGPTGVSHVSGRVQMLAPGLACLLCAGVLDPELVRRDLLTDEARAADSYIVGAAVPQPAVISLNSVASSLAVTMLLSAVTGVPVATRHQRLRLEAGVVSRVETAPAPSCPWCSPRGALARGDSWPAPGRTMPTSGTFQRLPEACVSLEAPA